jgi:hypothetical protein
MQVVTQYENKYHELLGEFDINSIITVNEEEILELIVE